MADGVTYADLRFAKKSRPEEDEEEASRPPGDTHEEASDGELTYENFPAAARPRQPASPDAPPQAPGAALRRRRGWGIWSAVPLALLGACLCLLATCLGLGVRYWQLSRQLEEASQRHVAEKGDQERRIGSREEELGRTQQQLSQAQAELDATWWALWQSWQACNDTQRRLDQEGKRAENCLTGLQQEKDKAARQLEEARSCPQMGCCPPGWTLFRWKCLWVSEGWKNWDRSRQDCERQQAQLLVLKPWDAGTIWGAAAIEGHLQSGEFWIGLHREWTREREWKWQWVDGTPYAGKKLDAHGECAKVSQGTLKKGYCHEELRYVCEKAATPFTWSGGQQ